MNLFQWIIMVWTVLVLAALLWVGRKEDRIGAGAFVAVMIATQFLYPLEIGNIRWGVALAAVSFLLVLLGLVAGSRRWWIIAAAGFELVAVGSYAVALADPDFLIWTGVSLRLVIWILQMLACGFGIAEALSQRRALPLKTRAEALPFSTE
jgi:hypothetical protein